MKILNENDEIRNLESEIEDKIKKSYDALYKTYKDLKDRVKADTPNLKKLVDKLNKLRNEVLSLMTNLDNAVMENRSFRTSPNFKALDCLNLLESFKKELDTNKKLIQYSNEVSLHINEVSKYVIKHSDLKKYPEKAKEVKDKAEQEDEDVEIDLDENFNKIRKSIGDTELLETIISSLDKESKNTILEYIKYKNTDKNCKQCGKNLDKHQKGCSKCKK